MIKDVLIVGEADELVGEHRGRLAHLPHRDLLVHVPRLPDGDGVVQLRWVPADGLDRGGSTVAVPALDAAILMER